MIREGLTFDDVLLVPKHSDVKSRSDIDISVQWKNFKFKHPVIPANMKTITGFEMALAVAQSGGLAILHRFMPIEEQLRIAEDLIEEHDARDKFAVSVGVQSIDRENVEKFAALGVRIICIDIAHGDSEAGANMTKWIRTIYPNMFIIAGNVATGSGARLLWEAGADAVKVGVGPGSLCTTRIETGNGVPQLSALMDIAWVKDVLVHGRLNGYAFAQGDPIGRPIYIIADGGIKNAGDVVKALCFADMVMVGNLFAGCEETPGNLMSIDGRSYKEYVGSSTHKTNHIEGVAAIVPAKGSFESILTKLLEGLRSGCSYQGAHNLAELRDNPQFIRITAAGLRESHPHDVILK